MSAYFDGMRRYADFSGRSTPRQFWLFMLLFFVALIVGVFLDGASGNIEKGGIFTALIGLAHIVPVWAVTARRLHDTGRSGWFALVSMVPLVGAVAVLVMCCGASQPKRNQFGDPVAVASPASAFDRDTYSQVDFSAITPALDVHRRSPEHPNTSAPTARPVNAPGVTGDALIERLERLAGLRAAGTIDETEFQSMKAKLLIGTQPAGNLS